MQSIKFKTKNNSYCRIEMPQTSDDRESFFLFSLHKSGSTLLNNMLYDVCLTSNIQTFDPERDLFFQGVYPTDITDPLDPIFKYKGYAYLGFRTFWPSNSNFDFSLVKNILLIRDPRDALVSHYFSTKFSHIIPDKGSMAKNMKKLRGSLESIDINDYVLGDAIINSYLFNFKAYSERLSHKNTQIYRYEDVVFFKDEWLKEMVKFLNIDIEKKNMAEIVRKYDIMPEEENPKKHVRQVTPGNYKKHLSNHTIKLLNKRFESILDRYGYNSVPVLKNVHSQNYFNTKTQNYITVDEKKTKKTNYKSNHLKGYTIFYKIKCAFIKIKTYIKLIKSNLFLDEYYRNTYPDVDLSILSPLLHYVYFGEKEKRNPNPFFITRWYVEKYPDINIDYGSPLLHYYLHGWKEYRDPGPCFSTMNYLAKNTKKNNICPLEHYLSVLKKNKNNIDSKKI